MEHTKSADNECRLDATKVVRALECAAAGLDKPTLARLRDARALAMGRLDAARTAPAHVFTLAGHHAHLLQKSHHRLAAALLLAALLLGAASFWHMQSAERDDSEVDIAILTGDLPMDVYVD